MKENWIDPFESLENTIVFGSKDWGQHHRDAWIYGIIIGWGEDDKEEAKAIEEEFKTKFNWTDNDMKRLKSLRLCYLKAKKDYLK